jgi:hypothetical protein
MASPASPSSLLPSTCHCTTRSTAQALVSGHHGKHLGAVPAPRNAPPGVRQLANIQCCIPAGSWGSGRKRWLCAVADRHSTGSITVGGRGGSGGDCHSLGLEHVSITNACMHARLTWTTFV